MEILDRNPAPDPYSIQEIELIFETTGNRIRVDPETNEETEWGPSVTPYLFVSLKPEPHFRRSGVWVQLRDEAKSVQTKDYMRGVSKL
jgi:hypothetical protein